VPYGTECRCYYVITFCRSASGDLRIARRGICDGSSIPGDSPGGSSDQCNTLWGTVELEGDRHGTHGASGLVCGPESGPVATRETRAVVKRDRPGARQTRRIDSWCGGLEWRVHSRGRRRSRSALTLTEREEISRGLAADRSIRHIASTLGRAPSTVSRGILRCGGAHAYRGAEADAQAWERARRPKPCRLATALTLQGIVASKLTRDWSPEQIAGGSSGHSQIRVRCRSLTKRSIAACSFKPEGCSRKNYLAISDPDAGCGEHNMRVQLASHADRSLIVSQSATGTLR
jgi:hypothetical protein